MYNFSAKTMHASFDVGLMYIDASAFSTAHFGRGSGQILLDDVRCTGSEDRLIDCRYDPNTGDCSHYEDASVRCKPKSKRQIVLSMHNMKFM